MGPTVLNTRLRKLSDASQYQHQNLQIGNASLHSQQVTVSPQLLQQYLTPNLHSQKPKDDFAQLVNPSLQRFVPQLQPSLSVKQGNSAFQQI